MSVGVDDGMVVGNLHDLAARECGIDHREVLVGPYAVCDHDHRGHLLESGDLDRPLADLDRLRCRLDNHERNIDRGHGQTREGPDTSFEVSDDRRVLGGDVPEQLLR